MGFVAGTAASLAGNAIIGVGFCLQKYALTRGAQLSSPYPKDKPRPPLKPSRSNISSSASGIMTRISNIASRILPASSGSRPYSRIRDPLWIIGIALCYLGEVGNMVSLSMISQSIVVSLGIFGVIVNATLSQVFLGEHITAVQRTGYAYIVAGVLLIIISAATSSSGETDIGSQLALAWYLVKPRVLIWLATTLCAVFYFFRRMKQQAVKSLGLISFVIPAAALGSITVTTSRFLSLLVSYKVTSGTPDTSGSLSPFMFVFTCALLIIVLVVAVGGQETMKQLALTYHPLSEFQPLFYGCHVALVSLAAACVFPEEASSIPGVVLLAAGISLILRGAGYLVRL